MAEPINSALVWSLSRHPPMKIPPLSLTCMCNDITVPLLSISKHTSLPIPLELCHCDTCRYSSGALAGAFIELKTCPPQDALDKCIKYVSSEKVSRYFCARCGSKVFLKGWSDEEPVVWFAWAGLVERVKDARRGSSAGRGGEIAGRVSPAAAPIPEVDLVKVTMQAFVEDTKDGGMVGRMCRVIRERERGEGSVGLDVPPQRPRDRRRSSLAKIFDKVKGGKEKKEEVEKVDDGPLKTVFVGMWGRSTVDIDEIEALITKNKAASEISQSERLLAQCRCGKVKFHVTRPDQSKQYPEHVQYYFKGPQKDKYLGRLCTCRSCRTATGNPLMAWIYVPPENIQTVDGVPIKFKTPGSLARLGITRIRRNGGEVLRSFCETCGATMFYEHVNRSWVIDIAAGILRSERGSLAEDFVEWNWDEVSYMEECQSKTFLRSVTGDNVRDLDG